MITAHEASAASEQALANYAEICGAETPDDLRKALEMMISKAARGIEKYSGNSIAVEVLVRTTERLLTAPASTKSNTQHKDH